MGLAQLVGTAYRYSPDHGEIEWFTHLGSYRNGGLAVLPGLVMLVLPFVL